MSEEAIIIEAVVDYQRELISRFVPDKDFSRYHDHQKKMLAVMTGQSAELASKDAEIERLRAASVEISDEDMAERDAEGFWHPCSGCHSTNEGAPTGFYSVHPFFKCELGIGCHECGRLGAVWDYSDYVDEDGYVKRSVPPTAEGHADNIQTKGSE